MNLPRPKPSAEPSIPWCLANRAGLSEYVRRARALSNLVPVFTVNGVTGKYPIGWSELTATINLEKQTALDPLTVVWRDAAIAIGGTFTSQSIGLADALVRAIGATSFYAKLVYFLPFLGGNVATARVPLIDSLAKGPAVNHNFVDADFSESLGLQGNGTTKYLDSTITPAACGSSNDAGLGWWENHFSAGFANVEPIGCYNQSVSPDDRFVIDMRSTRTIFSWGNVSTIANDGTPASNGHFYGNRSSNTSRILYKNGAQTAAVTTDDAATGTTDNTILICGSNEGTRGGIAPWAGRGAAAYITNGTMTAAEVAAFHAILNSNLVTPLGR